MAKIIGHLDMDAFFAAVEERGHLWLRDKPVVVGADPDEGHGRGVVSTANYKARVYGIHSAMPISIAWRLAEEGRKKGGEKTIFVRPDFKKYSETSEGVMKIIKKYSGAVEEASIDEAYFIINSKFEARNSKQNLEKAAETAQKIKTEILAQEKLTCSIGIGPNKMIAKIASDYQKPNGLTVVREDEAEKFLEPMSVRKIPGIGPKTEIFLNQKGIKTVADVKKFSEEKLEEWLGAWGVSLYQKARGKYDSPLELEHEVKSIGEQETFLQDSLDPNIIFNCLGRLAGGVWERFVASDFKAFKTVAVTARFSDFKTVSRAHTLKASADSLKVLEHEAMKLLLPFLDRRENPQKKPLRLIGVRIEKFV